MNEEFLEEFHEEDLNEEGMDYRPYKNYPDLKFRIIRELQFLNIDFKISDKPSVFTTKCGKIVPTPMIIDILLGCR